MDRLTTDKPVKEMGMSELALNCCYAGKDGWVRYRDYETEVDIRDFARSLLEDYYKVGAPETDDEEFGDYMIELLAENPHESIEGIIALLYRFMWANAELRDRLSAYEDTGLSPEEVKTAKTIAERLATADYPHNFQRERSDIADYMRWITDVMRDAKAWWNSRIRTREEAEAALGRADNG